jgi:hypothetical protein
MKSLLLHALSVAALLWITGCSVDQNRTVDEETEETADTRTTAASVVAKEDDEPSSTPPPSNKKSKPCPHDTPSEGDACSTTGSCFYAVERETYPLVTLVECRCVGSAWACFP